MQTANTIVTVYFIILMILAVALGMVTCLKTVAVQRWLETKPESLPALFTGFIIVNVIGLVIFEIVSRVILSGVL